MITEGRNSQRYKFLTGIYLSIIALILVAALLFLEINKTAEAVLITIIIFAFLESLRSFGSGAEVGEITEQIIAIQQVATNLGNLKSHQPNLNQDFRQRVQVQKALANQKLTALLPPIDVALTELGIVEKEKQISPEDKVKVAELLGQLKALSEFIPLAAEEYLSQGNALFWKDRYKEAITAYDKALQLQPDNAQAWYQKGSSLRHIKRYAEALESFNRALEIEPDNYLIWIEHGAVLDRWDRLEEALKSYGRAIEIAPENSYSSLAWYNRGVTLDKLGRVEEAFKSHERAVEIKPNNHKAWDKRGCILIKLNRYEEAVLSFDRTLEISLDKANPWYNQSCYFALHDELDKTLEYLKKAIELDPKYKELAKTDTDFDNIRQEQRFQSLIFGK
jgi:tetratricopeptide (TPR) repeat protein